MKRRLLVGLGNPGQNYIRTRHNIGFMVVDRLVARTGASSHVVGDLYHLWRAAYRDAELFFMKPQTFMNLSGHAVAPFVREHALRPDQVLVIYDDVALPLGRLRLRPKGSSGGHNGIANIADVLATQSVPRLRVGIDSPTRGQQSLRDFVLDPFHPEEDSLLSASILQASLAAWSWVRDDDIARVMGRFNARDASTLSS